MSTALDRKDSFDPDLKLEQTTVEHASPELIPVPPAYAALSDDGKAALNKSTTRKCDLIILPCIWFLYLLNYLDRQNIAAARLANLERDLGMTDTQYSTCVAILFVGYIVFQVPSNLILSKITKPAWWIILNVCLWGAISAATGAVQGYGGLAACRALLGVVEAVFFPGALFYLTCWYTKRQLAVRVGILYTGSQIGNAVAGLVAIGILKLDGKQGIQGWRWLFIIEGALTIFFGLLLLPIMPNNPRNALLLTEAEKDLLEYRLKVDRAQKAEPDLPTSEVFKLVLLDIKTYLFMAVLSLLYIATAVSNFFPTIVNSLGYDRTTTYGLTAPPYIIATIAIVAVGWNSDRTGNRFWHIVVPVFVFLIANIIAVSTLSIGGRYVAMCLLPGAGYSAAIVILSWLSGAINGPRQKRAVATAFINAVANSPNCWTAYLYSGTPRFVLAFSVNAAACAAVIIFAGFTRIYLARENAKIDAGKPVAKSGPTREEIDAGFRYPL